MYPGYRILDASAQWFSQNTWKVVKPHKHVFRCLKGQGPLKKIKISWKVEFLKAYRLIQLTAPLPGHFTVPLSGVYRAVSRKEYLFCFFKHFNQYFLCTRWWNSRFFQSFSAPFTIITFYLLLWNFLLILKMLTEALLRIPFSVVGQCSPMSTPFWLQGKCAIINL